MTVLLVSLDSPGMQLIQLLPYFGGSHRNRSNNQKQ